MMWPPGTRGCLTLTFWLVPKWSTADPVTMATSPNATNASPSSPVSASTRRPVPRRKSSRSPASTNLACVNRYGADARQSSVRANAFVIVALLLAGCSDDGGLQSGADTTVSTVGPRFIAAAPPGTILFSSNRHATPAPGAETEIPDFELYAVNPDGTELTQLTDSPGALHAPRWSPDGDRLAFIWTLDGTTSQVWTAARDGTNPTMLRDTDDLSFSGLTWSPDGTQLAYTDSRFIHILDLASGTDRRLVEGSWPAWSSLGTSTVVVYTSGAFLGEGSQTDLRAIDPNGTNDRPILLGSSDDPSDLTNASEASAEPGTSRIAFGSSPNGYTGEAADWDEQIYVVELIDANPIRTTVPILISRSPSNDHWPPAWSTTSATPDHACLVWTTDTDPDTSGPFTGGLVLAAVDASDRTGGGITEVTTPGAAYDWFPDWHPDAKCPSSSTT